MSQHLRKVAIHQLAVPRACSLRLVEPVLLSLVLSVSLAGSALLPCCARTRRTAVAGARPVVVSAEGVSSVIPIVSRLYLADRAALPQEDPP